MAKRPVEDLLATALRDLDAGHPAAEGRAGADANSATEPWLQLRQWLVAFRQPDPSPDGRMRGKQRMLAALAATPVHPGGSRMLPSVFTLVPKAATLVIGGLVLTGTAVGASAAVGGPNLPAAALTAIGLHADARSTAGIDNAPDAAQTGKDHADDRADDGSGNASIEVTATADATGSEGSGINRAPDAAQNGKDHANEHAFLGAGNASADHPATATVEAGEGIGNAPEAAQTGIDHAAPNASLGASNAAGNASLSAGNAPTETPPAGPPPGLTNAPEAAQVGIDHATSAGSNRP